MKLSPLNLNLRNEALSGLLEKQNSVKEIGLELNMMNHLAKTMGRESFSIIFERQPITATTRVQGEKYFSCKPNYGVFVKPDKVKVGDYPPVELNLDDDEEM